MSVVRPVTRSAFVTTPASAQPAGPYSVTKRRRAAEPVVVGEFPLRTHAMTARRSRRWTTDSMNPVDSFYSMINSPGSALSEGSWLDFTASPKLPAAQIRELIRPGLLILDDFARRQLTAAQADDPYELVSERQGRSLISTSNRAPSDWYPLSPPSRRRRVPPGPAHQCQPPGHHERPQLPPQQAPQEPRRQEGEDKLIGR